MPQAPTTRLGLYRTLADGSEDVDVVLDLLDNWDKLDAMVGALACTSGTRPASPFNGQFIRETDTSKMYVCTSTGPAVWAQVLFGSANFDQGITISSGNFTLSNGTTLVRRTSATVSAFNSKVNTDVEERFSIRTDGYHDWGGGAVARDTNLFRDSANVLKTDDSFSVGIDLAVTGNAVVGGTITGARLYTGSAALQSVLSTVTTVANTTTETALATYNVAANDAAVGAVYHIRAWGTCATTATPTMTFRLRLGGAAGTSMVAHAAITCRTMSDGYWEAEAYISCATTGAAGTWNPTFKVEHNFIGLSTYTKLGPVTAASVVKDTTVSSDLVITGQWSAASASNSIVCRGFSAQRVA